MERTRTTWNAKCLLPLNLLQRMQTCERHLSVWVQATEPCLECPSSRNGHQLDQGPPMRQGGLRALAGPMRLPRLRLRLSDGVTRRLDGMPRHQEQEHATALAREAARQLDGAGTENDRAGSQRDSAG